MTPGQKVLQANQSYVPFLGERMSFVRGLDPLGLQNTSNATFTLLMPGLNNITDRVRYYSFYSWLLDEYSQRSGNTDPKEQQKFIRTAEYIVALTSQYYDGDRRGIPGSDYAWTEVQSNKLQVHDLHAGIYKPDGTTAGTYWQYSWGIFGQYYRGSLRDMGVIVDREDSKVYIRSASRDDSFVCGEKLAAAFNENIPSEKKQLFFSCLSKGKITEEQLKRLLPEFNLTKIPADSRELNLLIRLLLQKDFPLVREDEPTTFRKDTISHLLDFVRTKPEQFDDRQFIYSVYDKKGIVSGAPETILLGWYFYQFNEFWQYANTSIFSGTLDYLENNHGPNWVGLHHFVKKVTKRVVGKFIDHNLLQEENGKLLEVLDKIEPDEYEFKESTSNNSQIEKIFYGFLTIFSLYLNNSQELRSLKGFGESANIARDGEGSGYFLREFKVKVEMPLYDYLRQFILRNIIYRHQYVAYRKMRGSGQSTEKFIIEDQHIRYLDNFGAGYTGPRIRNLITFLKDLGVLAQDDTLTNYGKRILNQIMIIDD